MNTKVKKLPRKINVGDLVLEIPTLKDADGMLLLFAKNRDFIGRYLNRAIELNTKEIMQDWIQMLVTGYDENKRADYFLKKSGKIIGMVQLHRLDYRHGNAEYGYLLDQESTGHGYISKCVKVLDEMLFDIGFERLVIGANPENQGSQNIALRNGYTFEGISRHAYFSVYDNKHKNIMTFAKIKSDTQQ